VLQHHTPTLTLDRLRRDRLRRDRLSLNDDLLLATARRPCPASQGQTGHGDEIKSSYFRMLKD
jgi:hypothetical protein